MSDVEAKKSTLARPYVRYSIAVIAIVAALLLHQGLVQLVGHELPPFIIVFPTIMIVAVFCGLWPGVLATILAALAVDYWLMPPRGALEIANAADAIALAIFCGMGIFMSLVAERYRRSQQRIEAYKRELALRESEEKLQQLSESHRMALEAAELGVWENRLETGEVWGDERYQARFGVTTEDRLAYDAYLARIHPDDRRRIDDAVKQAVAGANGGAYRSEFRVIWPDGSIHWLASLGRAYFEGVGDKRRAVRLTGINLDITGQKQAESVLQATLQRFYLILSNMYPGILLVTNEGRIEFANQAFCDRFGLEDAPAGLVGLDQIKLLDRIKNTYRHPDEALGRIKEIVDRGEPVVGEELTLQDDKTCLRDFVPLIVDGKSYGRLWLHLDITARKRTENALRNSRERLRLFINHAPAALAMFDNQMRYLHASQRWLADYGLGDRDLRGLSHYEVFPDIPEHWKQNHRRGLAGEVLREEADRFVRADGSVQWIRWQIHPWYEAKGAVGGIVIFSEDITEKRQAEEALRRQAEMLRLSYDAIMVWRLGGGIESWNHGAEQLYGYSESEALGRVTHELLRTFRSVLWPEVEAQLRQSGNWEGELRHTTKDGREVFISTRHQLMVDNDGVERILEINRDITKNKHAEEALRRSEERWATTLQSIGDAVISTDAAGKIEFMNDPAQKLTGWTLPEARGRALTVVFDILHEETRIKPEDPVAKVIRLGKVVGLANHTALIARNGAEFPIEDSAAPIRGKNGEIEGVVLVFHDVSEQRRTDRALRISDRLAITGRLAATIAHEIHNPLDTVSNLLYLIGQNPQADRIQEYVSIASGELSRITQMTQRMLAFQREAAQPVPVKISEILENVAALYERKIKAAQIDLKLEVDFSGCILAMPGELRQVFANLVGNAVEAMGQRRGTIILRAYESQDRHNHRRGVRVVVADDGPGILPGVRSKIFEPFFTTKGESGTGLGLWITCDIIRKYEGTIRLRTSTQPPLSGTCFSIFLPFEGCTDFVQRSGNNDRQDSIAADQRQHQEIIEAAVPEAVGGDGHNRTDT